MFKWHVLNRARLSSSLKVCVGLAMAFTCLVTTPAEARKRRHHASFKIHHRQAYTPAYSAIVVDANSGKTLHAENENALRHPASITKVMTLYLLFEQLEKGRLQLDSEIPMTAHAARQAPSKLGLKPGETIAVEDAIKAIVTKSANDVAVAVAEKIAGDEDSFAEIMTSKAQALGMSRTVYRNASGLPNNEQVTTARDLSILGRAIQDRFPRYYRYFSTHSFAYDGAVFRNHNHLLGRVEGMDGIKTGYTNKSGFNLLTSVKRDGHHIVAVVLGGRSARVRDQAMARLIENEIDNGASTRTAVAITENGASRQQVAELATPKPERETARPEPVKVEPVKPDVARSEPAGTPLQLAAVTLPVERPRPAYVSATARANPPASASDERTAAIPAAKDEPARKSVVVASLQDGSTGARPVASSSATPTSLRWIAGPSASNSAPSSAYGATLAPAKVPDPASLAASTRPVPPASINKAQANETRVARVDTVKPEVAKPVPPVERFGRPALASKGMMIQIGATDDASKAGELLDRARTSSKSNGKNLLASAQPFTEKVQKGDSTLYRARFAGLDADNAEAACKSLKRSGFSCFTTRN